MNPFIVYTVLDAHPAMTDDELKAQHRALSRRYHPDRPGGNQGLFVAVQQAYALVRTERDRFKLKLRLSGLGEACTACDGRGFTPLRRKFQVVGIRACEACDRCGYIERILR